MYSSTLSLWAYFAIAAWAFNPATDRAVCNGNRNFCLTSFIWCSSSRDEHQGCYFPANAYPYFDRDFASNPAGLSPNRGYNISWRNYDPEYPVQVEWHVNFDENVPFADRPYWTRNVTGSSHLEVTFAELFYEFQIPSSPNETVSVAEARGLASMNLGILKVSQPGRPVPNGIDPADYLGGNYWSDSSDQFYIFGSYGLIFMNTQAEIARNRLDRKWTLGVGIGVGIGAPLLMVAAFLAGRILGKRRGQRTVLKEPKASVSS